MTNNVLNLRVTPASSLVEFLEYDQRRQELLVKFKRGKYKGKQRKYADVSKSAFMQLLNAESIGKSLLSLIKDKKGVSANPSILNKLFA
ncbi:MAG: KTSC domain-containing protein [Bacteroidota bacterium]